MRTLGLRKGGIEVVSCPTCGRTKIDQISLANQVEALAAQFPNLDIKVAVMGCVVNNTGEAKEADLGIAGGIGEGLLIKRGGRSSARFRRQNLFRLCGMNWSTGTNSNRFWCKSIYENGE